MKSEDISEITENSEEKIVATALFSDEWFDQTLESAKYVVQEKYDEYQRAVGSFQTLVQMRELLKKE